MEPSSISNIDAHADDPSLIEVVEALEVLARVQVLVRKYSDGLVTTMEAMEGLKRLVALVPEEVPAT
jgi:hypothetical protein